MSIVFSTDMNINFTTNKIVNYEIEFLLNSCFISFDFHVLNAHVVICDYGHLLQYSQKCTLWLPVFRVLILVEPAVVF